MQRKLLLLFIVTFLAAPSFAYKVTTYKPLQPRYPLSPLHPMSRMQPLQPLQPMKPLEPMTPLNSNELSSNESYPKITQVESILFRRTYERENIYSRLSRIESKLFRRQFSNMPLASRMDNILANIDEGQIYGISSREISKLESKILGRTFEYEDSDSRITRLEKEMLGAMQQGNLKQRFSVVKTAAKHYNAFPQQYARNSAFTPNTYYAPRQKAGLVTKLVDFLAGGMGMGTMTGFTPPIYDAYPQFSPGMPGPGAGMQDYYMGSRGGFYNNKNIGSGAGVKVFY